MAARLADPTATPAAAVPFIRRGRKGETRGRHGLAPTGVDARREAAGPGRMTDEDPDQREEAAGAADVEEALAEHRSADDGTSAGADEDADVGGTGTQGSDDGASGGLDGETIEVTVPPDLLRAWNRRADTANLALSEYVVRMTEAGRMSARMQPARAEERAAMSVDQLAEEVVEELRHQEAVSWEQLVDAISRNLERRLEEVLEGLQEDDVVRYSGLKGGYQLVDEDGAGPD